MTFSPSQNNHRFFIVCLVTIRVDHGCPDAWGEIKENELQKVTEKKERERKDCHGRSMWQLFVLHVYIYVISP